nr:hypothetical protein [Actinomycetota bacterium]
MAGASVIGVSMDSGGVQDPPCSPQAITDRLRLDSSRNSHVVERFMEHVFLADVLEELWIRRGRPAMVAHSEVDATGFDLAIQAIDEDAGHVLTTSVQLKATLRGNNNPVKLNPKLWNHERGCLVWIRYWVQPDCTLGRTYLWHRCQRRPSDGAEVDATGVVLRHQETKGGDRIRVGGSNCEEVRSAELADLLFS